MDSYVLDAVNICEVPEINTPSSSACIVQLLPKDGKETELHKELYYGKHEASKHCCWMTGEMSTCFPVLFKKGELSVFFHMNYYGDDAYISTTLDRILKEELIDKESSQWECYLFTRIAKKDLIRLQEHFGIKDFLDDEVVTDIEHLSAHEHVVAKQLRNIFFVKAYLKQRKKIHANVVYHNYKHHSTDMQLFMKWLCDFEHIKINMAEKWFAWYGEEFKPGPRDGYFLEFPTKVSLSEKNYKEYGVYRNGVFLEESPIKLFKGRFVFDFNGWVHELRQDGESVKVLYHFIHPSERASGLYRQGEEVLGGKHKFMVAKKPS